MKVSWTYPVPSFVCHSHTLLFVKYEEQVLFIDTRVQYHNVCVVMYDFVTYAFLCCFLLRPFSGSPESLFN